MHSRKRLSLHLRVSFSIDSRSRRGPVPFFRGATTTAHRRERFIMNTRGQLNGPGFFEKHRRLKAA